MIAMVNILKQKKFVEIEFLNENERTELVSCNRIMDHILGQ